MTEETSFDEGFATMFPEKIPETREENLRTTNKNSAIDCMVKNQDTFNIARSNVGDSKVETKLNTTLLINNIAENWGINNLVGVQPITGPCGLVYSLQYQECADTNEYIGGPPNISDAKRPSLNIVDYVVEAGSRDLRASISIEAQQDMKTLHNIDAEAEILAMMGDNVAEEIFVEVLGDLVANSHTKTSDVINEGDNILIAINYACNRIGDNTRRGTGNWVVAGTNVLATLMDSKFFEANVTLNDKHDGSALRYVGTITGGVERRVFYSPHMGSNQSLCGYKGISEIDVGYVYSPYVPVMMNGPLVDPETFGPIFKFSTRYAKISFTKDETETTTDDEGRTVSTTTHLKNNYYYTLTFSNISEEYDEASSDKVTNLLGRIGEGAKT